MRKSKADIQKQVKIRADLDRLKWEYWNESLLFKMYWRYYRAKKLDPSTPFPEPLKKLKEKSALFEIILNYWYFWQHHEPRNATYEDYLACEKRLSIDQKRAFPEENKPVYIEDYRALLAEEIDIASKHIRQEFRG